MFMICSIIKKVAV